MYKKRAGCSSISGQCYETKLLSLILFRAQHDDNIEEFYLGANVENAGYFDDICFKAKIKGCDRPLVVFMQVRHRDNDRYFDLNRGDIVKYYRSYLKIKESFNPLNKDLIFNELFENTECICIFYSNGKSNSKTKVFESPFTNHLNNLVSTSVTEGCQLCYTEKEKQYLEEEFLKDEIKILANRFAKFIATKHNPMMMCDEYILQYHLILASNVVHVSQVDKNYSVCKFRHEFFDTEDEYLSLLREELYQHVIELFQLKDKNKQKIQEQYINEFLNDPSENTLINVIGLLYTYKNYELKFVTKMPDYLKKQLSLINLPNSTIKKAIQKKLLSLSFKVPPTFGNKDLILHNDPNKNYKRLRYLADVIVGLIEESRPSNVIYLDGAIPDGLLRVKGGLGSAVGNLLVYDDERELLKFSENYLLLEPNARLLLTKIREKVDNLEKYRFEVNIKNFPKIKICDHYNRYLVKRILDKIVFWTNQASHDIVELILKGEIENYETYSKTDYFRIKSDAIFLKYHNVIQKWWASPNQTPYLTKFANVYQSTVNDIVSDSLLSITSIMCMKRLTSEYSFNENALKLFTDLNSSETINTVVFTDITTLTVNKVIHYLSKIGKREYIMLDLKYIFEMLADEFYALISELENKSTIRDVILILVIDDLKTIQTSIIKFKKLMKALFEKQVIVVTNSTGESILEQYFPQISKKLFDVKHTLENLESTSISVILSNANVLFQGQEVTLDLLVSSDHPNLGFPTKFIEGSILRRIIFKEKIIVGGSLTNSNYDKMQHLFIERKVNRNGESFVIRTLFDITDDIVLITGNPGMGKSTLLTHLAVTTKKVDPKLWILKIDFLDCVKYFNSWRKCKTVINRSEMLKFMCRAVLQTIRPRHNVTISLDIRSNGDIDLENLEVDDEWAKFEVRLFLHFYMRSKVIFLFDGFDEISPYYNEIVKAFLKIVKDDSCKNKIWITSRVNRDVDLFLDLCLGSPYELQSFDKNELNLYLEKFWKTNIIFSKLDKDHVEAVDEFINKLSADDVAPTAVINHPLCSVYISFILYLITNIPDVDGRDKWRDFYNTSTRTLKYISVPEEGNSRASSPISCEIKTPLLAYLSAKYFANYVNHLDTNISESLTSDVSVLTIYEEFVKTKLLKHFIDNKKVDIYNPSIKKEFDEEFEKQINLYNS